MNELAARLQEVRSRIAEAATKAGRDLREVTLVAVTKTHPIDVIRAALDAGVTDIGENRALELKEKVAAFGGPARWHFVGHLQTNKARHVVGSVVLIHSIDRFAIAEAVARRARQLGLVQDVLIQVNVGLEPAKQGVEPSRTMALADEVGGLEGVRLAGLMTIPPRPRVADDSRIHYRELTELSNELVQAHPEARQVSMGMSLDYEVAVEEGATIVRVGEAIFGLRS